MAWTNCYSSDSTYINWSTSLIACIHIDIQVHMLNIVILGKIK